MCARQAAWHCFMSSAHVSVLKGRKHLRSFVCRRLELSLISDSFLVTESYRYVRPANLKVLLHPSFKCWDYWHFGCLNNLRKMQKESGL